MQWHNWCSTRWLWLDSKSHIASPSQTPSFPLHFYILISSQGEKAVWLRKSRSHKCAKYSCVLSPWNHTWNSRSHSKFQEVIIVHFCQWLSVPQLLIYSVTINLLHINNVGHPAPTQSGPLDPTSHLDEKWWREVALNVKGESGIAWQTVQFLCILNKICYWFNIIMLVYWVWLCLDLLKIQIYCLLAACYV